MSVTNCLVVETFSQESAGISSYSTTSWAEALAGAGYSQSLGSQFTIGCGGEYIDPTWTANRAFLCFDTTEIPVGDDITEVKIAGTLSGQSSGDVGIFEWTKTAENPPEGVTIADWTEIGSENFGGGTVVEDANAVEITLTGGIYSLINAGGYTFLVMRMDYDYVPLVPSWDGSGSFATWLTAVTQLQLIITHSSSVSTADAVESFTASPLVTDFISEDLSGDEFPSFVAKEIQTTIPSDEMTLTFTSQTNA